MPEKALPSTAHYTSQSPRTPPHAALKSSPACPPSLLTPCWPRPRRAHFNGWDHVRATPPRRGCPSRTAAPRGPRSRGTVSSIGLAAGARIAPASAPPPAPSPGACAAALQTGRGHAPQIFHAAPSRAGARRFNHARAHIPGTGHNSRGGRPRLAHAAEPPGPLHFLGHFGKLPKSQHLESFRERFVYCV